MYAITAIISRTGVDTSKQFPQGWESSRRLPTFYLDERVQGILSAAAAETVARDIVLPFGLTPGMTASITAVRVPGEDWAGEPETAVVSGVRLPDDGPEADGEPDDDGYWHCTTPHCNERVEANPTLYLSLLNDGRWDIYGVADENTRVSCAAGHDQNDLILEKSMTAFLEEQFPGGTWEGSAWQRDHDT